MSARFVKVRARSGYWYWQDNEVRRAGRKRRGTLGTKEEGEAERLVAGMNQAYCLPAIGIHVARAYLHAVDPEMLGRTWQVVMDAIASSKRGETQRRWIVASRDKNFDSIRHLPLVRTRAEHFWKALTAGTV